ncbi:DUF6318 family protein [Rothia mucilaginosa]|uniref:DUF6318 family protein n=1 Tax=Rothia mucilaginosa TaxID=43675 RepID=UPI00288AF94D|nr:DUF6318 family protein [Rothia mucilaginosa]
MTTNNDCNSVSQAPEHNPVQAPEQNPEQSPEKKKRFSRRTLGYAGVGVLTAAVVSRCTGLIKTPEELEEDRKKKQEAEEREQQAQKDRALAALEPNQEFVGVIDKSYAHKDIPLEYTAYESRGEFVPATEEHPAQNVPYPVLQPEMYEYSLQGFLTFMGYFCAALNYFYYTGDTEPLSKVVEPEAVLPETMLRLYREKRGWVISEQDVCKAWIYFPTSSSDRLSMSERNSRHIMSCLLGVSKESYRGYFYIPSIGEKLSLYDYRSPLGRKSSYDNGERLEAEHLNGRWTLLNNDKDRTPMYPADVPRTGES